MVTLSIFKITSSPEAGTSPLSQMVGSSQSPPEMEVTVAALLWVNEKRIKQKMVVSFHIFLSIVNVFITHRV
jgi:hypothetical protein